MEKNIETDNKILEQFIKNPEEYLKSKKGNKAREQETEITLNNLMQIQKTLDQARSMVNTRWTI